jgi:WhiB family redox-sensing transcriptional regulator
MRRELAAKALCQSCPVRAECAAHALAAREPYGVWGGFTEAERIRLLATGWEDLADRVRGRADVRRVDIRRLESRLGRESRLGPAQLPPPRQISALTAPLTRPRVPAVPRLTR